MSRTPFKHQSSSFCDQSILGGKKLNFSIPLRSRLHVIWPTAFWSTDFCPTVSVDKTSRDFVVEMCQRTVNQWVVCQPQGPNHFRLMDFRSTDFWQNDNVGDMPVGEMFFGEMTRHRDRWRNEIKVEATKQFRKKTCSSVIGGNFDLNKKLV